MTVLVLCNEPVIAALISMMIELEGWKPVFANPSERHADALHRLRPVGVVLLDVGLDTAHSDLFFTLAQRYSGALAVFGHHGRARDIAEIAGYRRIPWFMLPPEADRLARLLQHVTGPTGKAPARRRATGDAKARHIAEGTVLLRDGDGRHWMVYDRSIGNAHQTALQEPTMERLFVAEDGEILRYVVRTSEDIEPLSSVLEEQLFYAVQ